MSCAAGLYEQPHDNQPFIGFGSPFDKLRKLTIRESGAAKRGAGYLSPCGRERIFLDLASSLNP
jgi:hypothetical protein